MTVDVFARWRAILASTATKYHDPWLLFCALWGAVARTKAVLDDKDIVLEPPVYFGAWRADMSDERCTLVPVGAPCSFCDEEIADGDAGQIIRTGDWYAYHRECLLLIHFGHDLGVCGCTEYAGQDSRRDAAREAERRVLTRWRKERPC